MSARRLAFLAVAALVALAPLGAAGSQNAPEADDGNDDVEINGTTCVNPASGAPVPLVGNPCLWQPDFIWANIDIDLAWVNDTADALLFTIDMKYSTSFSPDAGLVGPATENGGFTYTYTVGFTVGGIPYVAIAVMGVDGVIAISGVASEFLVHDGHRLTLTVPKEFVGNPVNGDLVSTLVVTAHGEDDGGNTLDDRAPDADAGLDFAIANSTAEGPAPPPAATNTGTAAPGTQGPAVTGSSTGPTRPPVSGTSEKTFKVNVPEPTATEDEQKDTPAPTFLLLLMAFVAVGAFIRRRL
ncbi:MAG: hypothetical protein QOJ26_972 [Thermoplasmata archaeon]|nr:hypothetical protein [Thermoplasmata archaeon]